MGIGLGHEEAGALPIGPGHVGCWLGWVCQASPLKVTLCFSPFPPSSLEGSHGVLTRKGWGVTLRLWSECIYTLLRILLHEKFICFSHGLTHLIIYIIIDSDIYCALWVTFLSCLIYFFDRFIRLWPLAALSAGPGSLLHPCHCVRPFPQEPRSFDWRRVLGTKICMPGILAVSYLLKKL